MGLDKQDGLSFPTILNDCDPAQAFYVDDGSGQFVFHPWDEFHGVGCVRIDIGTQVVWPGVGEPLNAGQAPNGDGVDAYPNNPIATAQPAVGGWEATFTEPGLYPYYNPQAPLTMNGLVVVTDEDGSVPTLADAYGETASAPRM